jgi:hypothetical protein
LPYQIFIFSLSKLIFAKFFDALKLDFRVYRVNFVSWLLNFPFKPNAFHFCRFLVIFFNLVPSAYFKPFYLLPILIASTILKFFCPCFVILVFSYTPSWVIFSKF